jgi:hypothetical protein
MTIHKQNPAGPLVETSINGAVFVDELSAVVPDGTMTHLIFSARQPSIGGQMERIVQCRLSVPTDRLQLIGRAVLSGRLDLSLADEDGREVTLQ